LTIILGVFTLGICQLVCLLDYTIRKKANDRANAVAQGILGTQNAERQTVLAAVQRNGLALEFVSETLQQDPLVSWYASHTKKQTNEEAEKLHLFKGSAIEEKLLVPDVTNLIAQKFIKIL
jgi:hypothetical protein